MMKKTKTAEAYRQNFPGQGVVPGIPASSSYIYGNQEEESSDDDDDNTADEGEMSRDLLHHNKNMIIPINSVQELISHDHDPNLLNPIDPNKANKKRGNGWISDLSRIIEEGVKKHTPYDVGNKKRNRCVTCGETSRYKCFECDAHLHISGCSKKECWERFHNMPNFVLQRSTQKQKKVKKEQTMSVKLEPIPIIPPFSSNINHNVGNSAMNGNIMNNVLGMGGVGMGNIGMTGVGMTGVGMTGVGMTGVGMVGVGMAGVGMGGIELGDGSGLLGGGLTGVPTLNLKNRMSGVVGGLGNGSGMGGGLTVVPALNLVGVNVGVNAGVDSVLLHSLGGH